MICLILDQLSKALLDHFLEWNQSIQIVPSFFSITYVKNEGAAWSLFSGNQFFLILISFFALFIIYRYFIKDKQLSRLEICSYGLLLGGIFGNLIDRVLRGYVTDFLEFTLLGYHFPVFNLADIWIVSGVALIIIQIWKGDKYETNSSNEKCRENRSILNGGIRNQSK